jgi:L-amino acid N-acyltransferase YncA
MLMYQLFDPNRLITGLLKRQYILTQIVAVYEPYLGMGYGDMLFKHLLEQTKHFHVLEAGISLPNEASIRLHEKHGFRKVAHFNQVGFKFGKYIDVGFWELVQD